jgi:hypothetical protein
MPTDRLEIRELLGRDSVSTTPTTDLKSAIRRIGFAMVKNPAFEVALEKAFELEAGSAL